MLTRSQILALYRKDEITIERCVRLLKQLSYDAFPNHHVVVS